MSTTFLFEELDDATREYLTAVRDNEGAGAPGVFAPTSDSLPGCGCIAGPIVIVVTLLFTLTTWLGIIYEEPLKVAFLQTAGLLLGGWLLIAGFRGKGGSKSAGTWVYVDPLNLYEAYREQVTVTRIDEVAEARYTHNYDSNGNFQNSVVEILLGGRKSAAVTLANESRAEQMVTFLNYLAWARGPDGGERADLGPADLGGLAKYVVRNGDEPKDAENNINLNLVELDLSEVPEQPTREGRAMPAFLPYAFLFIGGILCFLVMAYIINPVIRDDAIYDAVMKDNTIPPMTEPRFLRFYLLDPRNTLHRETVTTRLARFYDPAMSHVRTNAADKKLGEGMAQVLKGLSTSSQDLVSLRITETKSPPGVLAEGKTTREGKLRSEFADGVNHTFANEHWGKPITLPAGFQAKDPLPPIGHQLIAFVEPPEEAKAVHFDITYSFQDAGAGKFQIVVNVTLRASIEDPTTHGGQFTVPGPFSENELDGVALTRLKEELIRNLVGPSAPALPGQPGGIQQFP